MEDPPAEVRPATRSDGTLWWVYLVRCSDGSLYAGITTDPARRLAEHNAGRGAAYTRGRRPVELVWLEPAADRSEASRRETQLKRLPRPAKLALARDGGALRGGVDWGP